MVRPLRSVLACEGGTREGNPSIHRASRPPRHPSTPRRPRAQPALVLARTHPRPLRVPRTPGTSTPSGGTDPVRILGALEAPRLAALAADQDFLTRLRTAAEDLDTYLHAPRWYQRAAGRTGDAPAALAYFSPEFGVTAALPQYSGGLGILAA